MMYTVSVTRRNRTLTILLSGMKQRGRLVNASTRVKNGIVRVQYDDVGFSIRLLALRF